MKKSDRVGFVSPTTEQDFAVADILKNRRYKFYRYGCIFGIVMFALGILFVILHLVINNPYLLSVVSLCLFSASIGSFIGGFSAKKECVALQNKEFTYKKGHIKEIRKRNSWSVFADVLYEDETVETFSVIGNRFVKDEDVYVICVNKNKAGMAIPRIVSYK